MKAKHIQNLEAPRVQVETALISTLRKNGIEISTDFIRGLFQQTGPTKVVRHITSVVVAVIRDQLMETVDIFERVINQLARPRPVAVAEPAEVVRGGFRRPSRQGLAADPLGPTSRHQLACGSAGWSKLGACPPKPQRAARQFLVRLCNCGRVVDCINDLRRSANRTGYGDWIAAIIGRCASSLLNPQSRIDEC